jgi:hypothetical protein
MTGSIQSRIRRLETELAIGDEDVNPEVILVVVSNRDEVSALQQVPFGIYVAGIPEGENGKAISARDYLRLVKEQHGDLLPDLVIPEPAAKSH